MKLIHVFVRGLCQWKWIWVSTSITVASFTGIGVCSRTIPPTRPAKVFTPPTERLIRVSDLPPSMETIGGDDNGREHVPSSRLPDRYILVPGGTGHWDTNRVADVTEPAAVFVLLFGLAGLLVVRRT